MSCDSLVLPVPRFAPAFYGALIFMPLNGQMEGGMEGGWRGPTNFPKRGEESFSFSRSNYANCPVELFDICINVNLFRLVVSLSLMVFSFLSRFVLTLFIMSRIQR